MWNLVTLDGFFEGAKTWDLGFHQYAWGDELKQFSIDQLRSADMLLFGRITYDGMAKYWQAAKGEDADYMMSSRDHSSGPTGRIRSWSKANLRPKPRSSSASGKETYSFLAAQTCPVGLWNTDYSMSIALPSFRSCWGEASRCSGQTRTGSG
jgi:hypothetical protein